MKTIVTTLLIILLSSILVFTITRIMPISPEKMLLSSHNMAHTKENIEALRDKWGLNKPLYIQYFSFIKGIFTLDFGKSLISGVEVKEEILKRLPYSLALGLGSLILSTIMAFFLGYLALIKEGAFDIFSRTLSLLSQSVPTFISAVFLIYILGVRFLVFRFFSQDPYISVLIGILLISLSTCGPLSRVVKKHFLELEDKSYIKRLYSHGLKREYVLLRYGYKPVLFNISGIIVSKFSSILGGSTVIEFAFSIPGISYFLIESIKNRDYNVIQVYLIIVMIWMIIVHLGFKRFKYFIDKRQSI